MFGCIGCHHLDADEFNLFSCFRQCIPDLNMKNGHQNSEVVFLGTDEVHLTLWEFFQSHQRRWSGKVASLAPFPFFTSQYSRYANMVSLGLLMCTLADLPFENGDCWGIRIATSLQSSAGHGCCVAFGPSVRPGGFHSFPYRGSLPAFDWRQSGAAQLPQNIQQAGPHSDKLAVCVIKLLLSWLTIYSAECHSVVRCCMKQMRFGKLCSHLNYTHCHQGQTILGTWPKTEKTNYHNKIEITPKCR